MSDKVLCKVSSKVSGKVFGKASGRVIGRVLSKVIDKVFRVEWRETAPELHERTPRLSLHPVLPL